MFVPTDAPWLPFTLKLGNKNKKCCLFPANVPVETLLDQFSVVLEPLFLSIQATVKVTKAIKARRSITISHAVAFLKEITADSRLPDRQTERPRRVA